MSEPPSGRVTKNSTTPEFLIAANKNPSNCWPITRPSCKTDIMRRGVLFDLQPSRSRKASSVDVCIFLLLGGTSDFYFSSVNGNEKSPKCVGIYQNPHCSFAYSALACCRMGMSGSASFRARRNRCRRRGLWNCRPAWRRLERDRNARARRGDN